jgi:hypothetical protein
LGGSSQKQILTPALWRIATPGGAGAIHFIRFREIMPQRRALPDELKVADGCFSLHPHQAGLSATRSVSQF